jgi:hypothetical protein
MLINGNTDKPDIMKNFTAKLPPYIALFTVLFALCVVTCTPSTDQVERSYNEGRTVEPVNADGSQLIKNLDHQASCEIRTEIFEADGYRYRIFWMGDGYEEASIVVINLDEQDARINHYRSDQ